MENESNTPAVTIESLQEELAAERTAHQETKDALASEQEAHQATQADRDQAHTDLSEATAIIDGQKQTIDEQAEAIVKLQTTPSAYSTITVDKVDYEVHAKNFKYRGAGYTVEQLLKDKKLQKELVGKGVGFLVKKEV